MAVTIWSGWWQSGDREDLGPGVYYNKTVGCINVPDNMRVKWYSNHQRTEGETGWILPSYIEEVYQVYHTDAKCLVIEECAVKKNDVVELIKYGYNNYRCKYTLPVGTHQAGPHTFPNDAIDEIVIPLGMTAEVFADGINSGTGSLIFTGTEGGNRVNLASFNYQDVITSLIITADEWELAGIELVDATIEEGTKNVRSGSITLHNNSDSKDTLSGSTTIQSEDSVTQNWDIRAGVTFNSETTAKASTGIFEIEQKVGLSISVEGGYGQNIAKSNGEEFTVTAEMEVPAHTSKTASIIIEYGTLKAKAVRHIRNKRTGQTITENGEIFTSKGYKATVTTT